MAYDCERVTESKSIEIHEHVLCCHFDAAHAQLVRQLLPPDADDRSGGDDGDDRDDDDDDDDEEEEEEGEEYEDQQKEQNLKELWILSRGSHIRTL